MTDYTSVLTGEERIFLALRELYSRNGFDHYRMSKFEEYDLYVRNKDFLVSDNVITFTDTDGRLLALKPDVTLSIIKNMKCSPEGVSKLYYDENVYRVSRDTGSFREIRQTGVECIGRVDTATVADILALAALSLDTVASEYRLELSHIDIVSGMLAELGVGDETRRSFFGLLGEKNVHDARELLAAEGVSEAAADAVCALVSLCGSADEVLPALRSIVRGDMAEGALTELEMIVSHLGSLGLGDKLRLDFSVVNNTGYYNGIAFCGYAEGVPAAVLIGGQYDNLMRKMGRSSRAVGFAVYVDALARRR